MIIILKLIIQIYKQWNNLIVRSVYFLVLFKFDKIRSEEWRKLYIFIPKWVFIILYIYVLWAKGKSRVIFVTTHNSLNRLEPRKSSSLVSHRVNLLSMSFISNSEKVVWPSPTSLHDGPGRVMTFIFFALKERIVNFFLLLFFLLYYYRFACKVVIKNCFWVF